MNNFLWFPERSFKMLNTTENKIFCARYENKEAAIPQGLCYIDISVSLVAKRSKSVYILRGTNEGLIKVRNRFYEVLWRTSKEGGNVPGGKHVSRGLVVMGLGRHLNTSGQRDRQLWWQKRDRGNTKETRHKINGRENEVAMLWSE